MLRKKSRLPERLTNSFDAKSESPIRTIRAFALFRSAGASLASTVATAAMVRGPRASPGSGLTWPVRIWSWLVSAQLSPDVRASPCALTPSGGFSFTETERATGKNVANRKSRVIGWER